MRPLLTLILSLLLCACEFSEPTAGERPELLVYCDITMAHPIQDIASIVGKEKGVRITITQGGSEDLYKSLAASRKGDLYLPGSASYRERHLDDGLLKDFVHVGYNQAAIMVGKGNPRGISNDPTELTRQDLGVVIASAKTGSIGRESKRILSEKGIYPQVLDNAVYLTTDSRNLNRALRRGDADVIINWRATAFFDENRDAMEVLDLEPSLAKPKKLLLNRLSFSSHPEIARYFMEYAASEKGQAIFRRYGFIGNTAKP